MLPDQEDVYRYYNEDPDKKYHPKYSGSTRSGICTCGCRWDEHHLSMVMRQEYVDSTGEIYVPDECCRYGFNEVGGMKYNPETKEWEDHCHRYCDSLVK